MVWGQAYGGAPSAAAQDPFAAVERDTRAMVTAGWWPATPPFQRQNLVAGRMLALPDGSRWVFGAWARWYRWSAVDGQWHLCPPPMAAVTRMSARPLRQDTPAPRIPPHLVPSGPDFGHDPPRALPFVDTDVRPEVTSRVRATVESAAALPPPDYPHWWEAFSSSTPSTVAVGWGVMLWSAAVPVFDSRLDDRLLGLWSPYRARPLPPADGPRWLTPPPLEALVGLYAERLRAGRVDAAVVILRTMWAMVSALRDDPRFQARADALLAVLGATLQNPTVDYGVLPYGDQALVQQWLTRCPPALAPALRIEASAGDHLRNAFYDLAVALAAIAGDPAEPGYLEPRLMAAALLAADLEVVRRDVAGQVTGWLDPEIRHTIEAVLDQPGHPLRRIWPEENRLPASLRRRVEAIGSAGRGALLASAYTADLAWCRLGGGIPARPRGFPMPVAILAEILGPERALSAAPADPLTPTPGPASLASRYPADPVVGARTAVPPTLHRPPTGPPGQAPAWAAPPAPSAAASGPAAPPATGAWPVAAPDHTVLDDGANRDDASAPATRARSGRAPDGADPGEETQDPDQVTMLDRPSVAPSRPDRPDSPGGTRANSSGGVRVSPPPPSAPVPPGPVPLPAAPGPPGPSGRPVPSPVPPGSVGPSGRPVPSPVPPGAPVPPRTRVLGEAGPADGRRPATRILGEPQGPGGPSERPGTRIMSQTMVGDLLGAPMPGRPVGEIEPPPEAPVPEVIERFGIRFVCGSDDAATFLDEVHRRASSQDAETAPTLLLVGAPHSGQRRLARLVARTLAAAGGGDGSVRTADGTEPRDDRADALEETLRGGGPPLLFEWLDAAMSRASDPGSIAAAVTRARADGAGTAALIATCEPASYDRMRADHPELVEVFTVFRLPDLGRPETRLALVHVLADERRVTVDAPALRTVQADLPRLTGYGDLVGARLVEAYLDRAVARHTERFGASRDRLVLSPADLTGVAEEIQPSLRAPRDVDGFLRSLDEMIGLDEVKKVVEGLVTEARLAAERAARGLPSGEPSRHLIFLGRPGTGKRTVAGLIGDAYAALNLLDSGQVVVCHAREPADDDAAAKVAAWVDRAMGGVLLVEDAPLLDRTPAAVAALLRHMRERHDEFMVVCSGEPGEMDGFLHANPEFRAEFDAVVEFREPTDRQLVQLFTRFAERDLYLLDEELRVELLGRFGEMRRSPGFAFAETARRLFDEIVARQAARLAGARVDAATVARLSVRDLPESTAGRLLKDLYEDRTRR